MFMFNLRASMDLEVQLVNGYVESVPVHVLYVIG